MYLGIMGRDLRRMENFGSDNRGKNNKLIILGGIIDWSDDRERNNR
jgi:hypothetical protein